MQILITRVMDRTPRPQQTHTLALNTTSHVSKPVNTRTPTAPPFFPIIESAVNPTPDYHSSFSPPRILFDKAPGGTPRRRLDDACSEAPRNQCGGGGAVVL